MAKKTKAPELDRPPANSSSEEYESGDEELEEQEEDSSSDEEEDADSPPSPPPPSDKKPTGSHKKKPEPDISSGSDSESDIPTTPIPDPKPMDEPSKLKKSRSKPAMASPTRSPAVKRPLESEKDAKKDSKRTKGQKSGGPVEDVKKNGEDAKKQVSNRFWSEEDEVEILKSIIQYKEKKGADPKPDGDDFQGLVKKSLHVDASKKQIVDKIRRLKKKYENFAGKKSQIMNPHDKVLFELSEKIWGNGGLDNGKSEQSVKVNKRARSDSKGVKSNGDVGSDEAKRAVVATLPEQKPVAVKSKCEEMKIAKKNLGFVGNFDVGIVDEGLDLLDDKQREMLEGKWRKQREAELEVFLNRLELMTEQTKLALDAMRAAGN